ncbi:MAG: MFS transporter [Spirochaetales bacterium]|nr:MFS transporter [Spirochaetales bacterium]
MITTLSLAGILLLAVDAQVFPSILTRLGGSSVQEGLLLAALFVLYPLSSMAAGVMADRIGKRGVVAGGFFLVALPFALSAVLPEIGARTLAVLLFGLGGGVIESQVSALISDLHPDRERAVMNLSQTMFTVGAAGGPLLIGLVSTMSRSAGLSPLLWGAAVLNFVVFGMFLAAPGRRTSAGEAPAPRRRPGDPDAGEPPAIPLLSLLREPLLWLLAAAIFLYVAAEMGTAGWLAKFGETELGMSRSLAPLCLSAFWGGLGVSRTVFGLTGTGWSDRTVLVFSLALSFCGQLLAFSAGTPALSLAGIAVTGLGMGAVWPTLVALAAARFRRASGTAVGIVVAAGALAVPIVQSVVGLTSRPELLGLRRSLLALSALTLLDLFLVLGVFGRHEKTGGLRRGAMRRETHRG